MLRDPLAEKLEICKNLWDLEMYRVIKAYIAKRICKYNNDIIAKKLDIGFYQISSYATNGKTLLDRHSDAILNFLNLLTKEDAKDVCKKLRKGGRLRCGGVYHALFLAKIISESFGTSFLADKVWSGAKAVHIKVFPLFYILYNANAKNDYEKIKVKLKRDEWHVSAPSAIYVYYVISRVNAEPVYFNMIDMSLIADVIEKLSTKNVMELMLTREDAQLASKLVRMAIEARYPAVSWR